eukprot:GGOE01004118.1.p1 GENE.GGOE01004118.1~~GGOE01004118.1.p1  ORF type:complete len:714 (-),score=155.11 GGOE01004118.1:227-2368(-)
MASRDEHADELVEVLYNLLWQKRDDRAQADHAQYWFGFLLPDTILFKQQLPSCWYFSTTQANADPIHNNRIRRKKSQRLTREDIMNGLLHRRTSSSGIVASCYSMAEGPPDAPKLLMKHLDRPALSAFFAEANRRTDCVLQAFVDPKSGADGAVHNSMIQSVWFQPGICLVEKRENRHDMSSRRWCAAAKTQTFEGFDQSEEVMTSTLLQAAIKQACEAIVRHIGQVAGKQVQRMALAWKVDARDRLQLLYCSQLRMHDAPIRSHAGPFRNVVPKTLRNEARGPSERERGSKSGQAGVRAIQVSQKQQFDGNRPLSPLRFEVYPLESSRDKVRAEQEALRSQHEEEKAALPTADHNHTDSFALRPISPKQADAPPSISRLAMLPPSRPVLPTDAGGAQGAQGATHKHLSFAGGLVLSRWATLRHASTALQCDFLEDDGSPSADCKDDAKKEAMSKTVQRLMDLITGAAAVDADTSPRSLLVPTSSAESQGPSRQATALSVRSSQPHRDRTGERRDSSTSASSRSRPASPHSSVASTVSSIPHRQRSSKCVIRVSRASTGTSGSTSGPASPSSSNGSELGLHDLPMDPLRWEDITTDRAQAAAVDAAAVLQRAQLCRRDAQRAEGERAALQRYATMMREVQGGRPPNPSIALERAMHRSSGPPPPRRKRSRLPGERPPYSQPTMNFIRKHRGVTGRREAIAISPQRRLAHHDRN